MKYIFRDKEYDSMRAAMEARDIFSVEKNGDGFTIAEECDRYFTEEITREQLLALAEELKALANS